jgi:glycine cleavage system H protein
MTAGARVTIVPEDLQYTDEHEWVRRLDAAPSGGGMAVVRVGITDHAQDALGDVVYVSLPVVGTEIRGGDAIGEIESTKSVSELFAPVAGVVVSRNDALDASPELLNSDPYGEGWIIEIEVEDAAEIEALLDPDAYTVLIAP